MNKTRSQLTSELKRLTFELDDDAPAVHHQLAGRASVRRFRKEPVSEQLLRRLCALALSAPTKSDLQQRDIIIVSSLELRSRHRD